MNFSTKKRNSLFCRAKILVHITSCLIIQLILKFAHALISFVLESFLYMLNINSSLHLSCFDRACQNVPSSGFWMCQPTDSEYSLLRSVNSNIQYMPVYTLPVNILSQGMVLLFLALAI